MKEGYLLPPDRIPAKPLVVVSVAEEVCCSLALVVVMLAFYWVLLVWIHSHLFAVSMEVRALSAVAVVEGVVVALKTCLRAVFALVQHR